MLTQFIPHGHCYLWKYNLVGLHLISDLLIAISYYSIPITLVYFIRKRNDLPYPSIFILFTALIISCGSNHLMEIWVLWHPTYWISGIIKAITALVSVYMAIELIFIIPQFLNLPTVEQLRLANEKLEEEIQEHERTEKALKKSESTLRSFYDSAPMMMGIVELIDRKDLSYISSNNTAAAFFGLTSETMQGKLASELWNSKKVLHRLISACIQSKNTFQPVSFEFTHNVDKAHQQQNFNSEIYPRQDTKHFSITISKIDLEAAEQNPRFSYLSEDISTRKRLDLALQESEERFRLAFEDAPIGMAIVALEGLFLKVNSSLCEIVGYSESEFLSLTFQEITHPEDLNTDLNFVSKLVKGSIHNYQMEKRYFHKLGHVVWILLSVSLVRNLKKTPQYFVAHIQDISKRKEVETEITKSLQEKLEEKEVLLKEIHHRVKNNLQVICSLLNLQSRYLKEERFIHSFRETQNRVKSMALVHEQLYQSKNISQIVLFDYIEQLLNNLFRAYSIGSNIKYQTKIDDFKLDLDSAVPFGLIVNEVISNALKYAFYPKIGGRIMIETFANLEKNLVLVIEDNGKGLEPDFAIENSKSLGLKLVKNLTQQLQGKLEIQSDVNAGTRFEFIFTRIKKEVI